MSVAFAGTMRFEIVRSLGRGGMGHVFEAFDRERSSTCALKLLPRVTPASLVRFKREFRALQGLAHANLISFGELLNDRDHWFFTMELVDGVDFLTWVCGPSKTDRIYATVSGSDDLPLPPDVFASRPSGCDTEKLSSALAQLAHGLAFLHSRGRIHRDVKPSNILVTPTGRLVLLDFGLVAHTDDLDAGLQLVGTPGYMAPEYLRCGEITAAGDMYAVGVMLYNALTGAFPRGSDEPGDRGPRPRALVPEAPEVLDDLCSALLAPDPSARPSATDVLDRLGAHCHRSGDAAVPFVGRDAELATLQRAYADSRRAPVAVVVDGPSGIGKSALLDELVERLYLAHDVPLVLRGRCYESEGIPYKAIDGVVDALADVLFHAPAALLEGLPAEASQLGVLFPSLRRIPALHDDGAVAPLDAAQAFEARRRAEHAARALFAVIASWCPVVILIDDVHWSDRDSIALLSALTRGPDAPALLLVVASRLAEVPPLGDDIRHVSLTPLPDADAQRLAAELLRASGDAAHAPELAAEAGGNPFFINELALRANGGSPAPSLDELVRERVDACLPDARRVLELTAVSTVPLHQRAIADAAALPPARFRHLVEELRARRLVRTGGLTLDDPVEPHHDRVRQAVVASLPGPLRREHHLRLARAIETHAPDHVDALVTHFDSGGEPTRAGRYAVRAGELAARSLAFERAAQYFRRALLWLPEPDAQRERVREQLGDALANAGLGAEAAAEYGLAARRATSVHALELRRRAAEHLLRSGRLDDGIAALRDLLGLLNVRMPSSPTEAFAGMLFRRAHVRLRGLQFRERRESTLAPEDLFRVDTLWVAAARLGPIDPIAAIDFQARHLLDCLELGEPFRIARALLAEAVFASIGGPRARGRVEAVLARARPLVDRIQHPYASAMLRFTDGFTAFQRGDFLSAQADLSLAADEFRRNCPGANHDTAVAERFALDSLVYTGDLDELARRLPRSLEDAERRGDLYLAAELCTGLPNMMWLARDRSDEARRRNERGIEPWPRGRFYLQHYYHLLADVNIALYDGDGDGAFRTMEEGWRRLRASMLLQVQAVRTEALFLRARAALARGGVRALTIARKTSDRLARERVAWAPGLACAVEASLAVRAGDRRRALALLAEAQSKLARAGAGLVENACRVQRSRLAETGDERDALAWFVRRGIERPERFVALNVPMPQASGA